MKEAETRDFSERPFAGVPIFLKDLGQEQAGEPSTAGSRLFTSYRATETDNYVKKLEELGFIILGRSSTPEFGFKNISDVQIHGSVNLPDDVTRNAGAGQVEAEDFSDKAADKAKEVNENVDKAAEKVADKARRCEIIKHKKSTHNI